MNKSIFRATRFPLRTSLRAALWTLSLTAPTSLALAQDAPKDAPKPPAAAPTTPAPASDTKAAAKSKLEIVGAGELRIDGKITAILGEGVWQVEAVSWTSPRGVTTNFDEIKRKSVSVSPTSSIHPRADERRIPLKDVKLGLRLAIIGKNGPDGTLVAREVVLLEGYGTRTTAGSLSSNPFTSALVAQSRAAREAGQLAKALDLVDKAIASAQGLGDRSGEGLATQDKALLYQDLKQPQEAFKASQRVEALGRDLGNPLLLTLGLSGEGGMLLASGQSEKALDKLREADTLSVNMVPSIHLGVLSRLATAYLASGDLSGGIGTLNRVFPLEQAAGAEADAGETKLFIALLQADAQPDDAHQALTDAQPLIDRTGDQRAKAGLLGAAAAVQFRLGEREEAAAKYTQAAALMTEAGDEKSAKTYQGMIAKLEKAPTDWQGFWLVSSGLGEIVKKAEEAETPAETPAG